MDKPRVPVIWNYDFSEVIGSATVSEDGTVTFAITDPKMVELIKKERECTIAISLSHTPAVRSVINYCADCGESLIRVHDKWASQQEGPSFFACRLRRDQDGHLISADYHYIEGEVQRHWPE